MNIITNISQAFLDHIATLFPSLAPAQRAAITTTLNDDPQRQAFGDISSNAAMILAKHFGKAPRVIAEQIVASFQHPLVRSCDIAGAGFINLSLTDTAFQQLLVELATMGDTFFKASEELQKTRYSVEFVSANPTGPLHIGHGRGGIIGDMITRVLKCIGVPVTAEFYINDAGNQITKLGQSLKIRCQQELGLGGEIPEDGYHGEYLKAMAQACIAEEGKHVVEQSDEFFASYAKERMLAQLQRTLADYQITFDVWFSELTLHQGGAIETALERLRTHGYLYEKEGALWFRTTELGDDKDRVVKKSSGEYTYVAADIAYLQNKVDRGFDKIVMVLGQDHHSYLVRLKAAMQALGHNPDRLDIILYQLVALKNEGELLRLSKRAGRIVSLQDIIDTVGTDVARFFYINRKADAHLDFDLALALKQTEENPVYYLQYAYVRTGSILEKASQHEALRNVSVDDARHLTEAERLILKKIASLQHVLEHIATTYQTHMLAYYVLELAHLFHSYYAAHRVIDLENLPQTRARLLVVQQLRATFTLCLSLLGLSVPERM